MKLLNTCIFCFNLYTMRDEMEAIINLMSNSIINYIGKTKEIKSVIYYTSCTFDIFVIFRGSYTLFRK